jgi:hypothetical protein
MDCSFKIKFNLVIEITVELSESFPKPVLGSSEVLSKETNKGSWKEAALSYGACPSP